MSFKPVRKYLITYTSCMDGEKETHTVAVSSMDAVNDWTDRLDDRIARGTCTGYLVTMFDTWEMVKNEADERRKTMKRCCICGKQIDDWGNNAEPVKQGRCCDACNWEYVIPARLLALYTKDKQTDGKQK